MIVSLVIKEINLSLLQTKAINYFKYWFSENGLVAFKDGKKFAETRINEKLGEDKLQKFINFCLIYIANLNIPVKRGTFIEFRTGLINVSPIGRNCSQSERNDFALYNKEHKVLETFQEVCQKEFVDLDLNICIGGQISFDVYPNVINLLFSNTFKFYIHYIQRAGIRLFAYDT